MSRLMKALPKTAFVAVEFVDRQKARSFLERCLANYPSIDVELVAPNAVIIARDQVGALSRTIADFEVQVMPVGSVSDLPPDEAARLRRRPRDRDEVLRSHKAMLEDLERGLARPERERR